MSLGKEFHKEGATTENALCTLLTHRISPIGKIWRKVLPTDQRARLQGAVGRPKRSSAGWGISSPQEGYLIASHPSSGDCTCHRVEWEREAAITSHSILWRRHGYWDI